MEKSYDYAVMIGRWQPFHNAHYEILKYGLSIANKVIIAIGSSGSARTIKNPFTFEERKEMIRSTLSKEEKMKVHFIPVRDYFYNDNLWCAEIQSQVDEIVGKNTNISLIGNYKDSSSYYLNLFPQWDFNGVTSKSLLNATDIRNHIFTKKPISGEIDDKLNSILPPGVINWLNNSYFQTPRFAEDIKEFEYINNYKKSWENAPFPPTFNTADALVSCSGHVLVIERGFAPGKGLYALPGGFIGQTETIADAAIRELKEETRISLDKRLLKSSIVDQKVFDYPGRSLRGRTITHAFHIKLTGEFPSVKFGSDATKVHWMSITDLFKNEHKFFEDHFSIIQHFILRN